MNLLTSKKQWYGEDGYATLLGVLIVGAVSTSAILSMLSVGMQSSRTSFVRQQSAQARSHADACVEEALQEIHDDTSYAGSDRLSFPTGDCEYTVTGTGQQRTITAEGFVDSISRKVLVDVGEINPEISIDSWQEVADF